MNATNSKAGGLSSQISKSTSSMEKCEKEISSLSRESRGLRRALLSAAKASSGFSRSMDNLEDQLGRAQARLARAGTDLELNETAVMAKKILDELGTLAPLATGAAVAGEGIYVAREFRELRSLLGKMQATLNEMAKRSRKTRLAPGKIALLSFSNSAKLCKSKLSRLGKLLTTKDSRAHARLFEAKSEAHELLSGVDETLLLMTRSRLKGKIRASKAEILSFMRRNGSGRIFLDHKHLTFRSGKDSISLPFSQVTRFCMEDMVPMDRLLDNVGKSAVVIGSFEGHNGGARISIGERAVVGNTIVYREKTFLVE
ncbi:MAG: hypothetical protein NTX79_05395 [Candidatus Micrarchaeota archaeon]|nr:hypothetical protein [Candidatus Micrarchaeota archaeon]